jgi:hypothetical protein
LLLDLSSERLARERVEENFMAVEAERATHEREALQELAAFSLLEALYGRRSRRFALADVIPDGPLACSSEREPVPLTERERRRVQGVRGLARLERGGLRHGRARTGG